MNQTDLDKLKLLANDDNEYLKALLVKLRQNAISNMHDMSAFVNESAPWSHDEYNTYCKRCDFQISVEDINNMHGRRIYFDLSCMDRKCVAI